ncbi:MAG: 50S ribosomal protein L15 [Candidatus Woykebacteria bacterium RBG_16_43_9]|uniref:Large ribosomal subunit protein uL15 n=1 Tax=Candidatus Woykebacteria bacterium RBG_16_43_9 TaxID=1802596 RepID=A0A1G1WGC8_9BACT|nr:MAG: 50S ribosomal protein L15 [Candidatus Woykebacteria bacterium RBG_16_43_9]
MKLHELVKVKSKQKKRIGRGAGSGKGKTAARGMKGQKSREKIKIGFEGGQLPLYQRLPQKRGLGNIQKVKKISVTTKQLNKLASGTLVNIESLKEAGLVPTSANEFKIKIVYSGKLDKKLKVGIPTSKKAKAVIEKIGGRIVNENPA